jgi:hypothetical protein
MKWKTGTDIMSKTRISLTLGIAGASALALAAGCSSSDLATRATPDDGGPDVRQVVGTDVPDATSADAADPTSYTRIDDMESMDGRDEWSPPAGASRGYWGTKTGDGQSDHISPDESSWSYAPVPTPYETFPGITSTHAARLRTVQPLVDTWGAGMALPFAPPADAVVGPPKTPGFGLLPVDLSAYKGITFWAMAAQDPQDTTSILVQFWDKNTFPGGGPCLDADGGTSQCYSGFATTLSLTGEFKQYTIDFSTLAQEGWGFHPLPDALDLQSVYMISVHVNSSGVPSSLSFDVWIDDLYFVNR